MALLWCDGFDHYGSTANMALAGWTVPSTASLITASRTGGYAVTDTNILGSFLERTLGEEKTAIGVGFAIKHSSLPTNYRKILGLFNKGGYQQCTLYLSASGTIVLARYDGLSPSSANTVAESAQVFQAGTYNHLESYLTYGTDTATAEVRLNGVTVIDVSGISTSQIGTLKGPFAILGIHAGSGLDDVFCWDTEGDFNNDFLGDCRVRTLLPSEDTTIQEWTVVGAGSAAAAISEVPADGDTSYLTADTVDMAAEFVLPDLPATVTSVAGLYVTAEMKKDDAGDSFVQIGIAQDSGDTLSSDKSLTTTYAYYGLSVEYNPDTGAPFTPDEVAAVRFKVVKTDGS